ncbi:cupin domain-containing protein [Candidatus Pacearchaeota archaeon]|nr:cupin domain-containing protein [Candidatus Pacearchaeota archaeon]
MKYSRLEQIPLESSHGKIEKKVMIKKRDVPNLMMFNWAKFKPGQFVEPHKHDTMYETYYGLGGKLLCKVEGKEIYLGKGDCLTTKPGEIHEMKNIFKKDATILYFGISIN